MPAGMTEADLGIKSIPRNPLLFGILHRMEAVERTCLRAVTHRQVGVLGNDDFSQADRTSRDQIRIWSGSGHRTS